MMKKLIWLVVLAAIGFGLWKLGVYYYQQMEQEEAARQMQMEKSAHSAAEGYANPAASALEQKARNLERKTQESEDQP